MANERLTSDDLDALGSTEGSDRRLLGVVQTLLRAVDEDGLADPADTGYALFIAADLTSHTGDRATAIDLAERAVAADLVHTGSELARGLLAELLFADDRETEAFLQLEPLRALMTVDAHAGRAAAEALEASGRAELAVEWLTEALTVAIEVGEAIPEEQEEARDHAAGVVYELVVTRHAIREELGLDHDDYDRLADELKEAVGDGFEPGPVLFWPESEYAELLRRWPYETETFTPSWDAHRTMVETELQAWASSGHSGLSVIPGTVADLVALIEREGVTVVDEEVQLDYLDELVDSDVADLPWPPPRNGVCWCGSGAKYKKCCLPRPRS